MRTHRRVRALSVFLLAAGLAAAGCDGGPKLVRVRGVVTYNGTPVPRGEVVFSPAAGGKAALAALEPDGTFVPSTFRTGDGLVVGDYLVGVQTYLPDDDKAKKSKAAPPVKPFPPRYGDVGTSGLKVSVTPADEGREYKIDLKD